MLLEDPLWYHVSTGSIEALGLHDFNPFTKFLFYVFTKAVFANHMATVTHRENFVRLTLTVTTWTIKVFNFFIFVKFQFEIKFVSEEHIFAMFDCLDRVPIKC